MFTRKTFVFVNNNTTLALMYHVRVSMAVRIELFNARVIYHSLDSNSAGSVLIAASEEIVAPIQFAE